MHPPVEHAGADHPLDRILQLGATDHRRAIALALAAALLAHGGMAGAIRLQQDEGSEAAPLLDAQEVFLEREVPAAPPVPEPEPAAAAPPPVPEPPKSDPNVQAAAPDPTDNPYDLPASEAARAGEVLTQESDEQESDEEDDEEQNTFVTADAGTYAGGMTASSGTSAQAVRGSIAPDAGVLGGAGTLAMAPQPKPPGRDLSRDAWLDGSTSWDDCDFPGEADRDRIRDAVVQMTVTVRPNGTAQAVEILGDPGHGFARTATACALRHKFAPALDALGRRILGRTRPFHVGFHR